MKSIFITLKLKDYPESLDYCYDAEEALSKLEKSISVDPESRRIESDYCLVLSDLNMPIMDGYEFAKRAKRLLNQNRIPKDRHPKLVAVTGNVESAYIRRCFECHFDQVFSKPIYSENISLLALE